MEDTKQKRKLPAPESRYNILQHVGIVRVEYLRVVTGIVIWIIVYEILVPCNFIFQYFHFH